MGGDKAQESPLSQTPTCKPVAKKQDETAVGSGISGTVRDEGSDLLSYVSGSAAVAQGLRQERSGNIDHVLEVEDQDGCEAWNPASTSSKAVAASHGDGAKKLTSAIQGTDDSGDFGDLTAFVEVAREQDNHDDDELERYDAGIDIPLPRRHPEVARAKVAKSTASRLRADLHASEEATRPFSRMNRSRTAKLLIAREKRSRQEVEKVKNASAKERGIDESLIKEIRGLNVLEQARHPLLQNVPLLSKSWASSKSKHGRSRRRIMRITDAFGFVDDNDHRVLVVSVQGESLDDAWVTVLGSTLETNQNVHSVLLNRNDIGDKGVALLARSLRNNSSVKTLSLGGNRLTDGGARSLAGLLKSGRSSLKALNLAGATPQPVSVIQGGFGNKDPQGDERIGAPGAAALAQALGDTTSCCGCSLLYLNLAFQRVWDEGAVALAAVLKTPACKLEALGLSSTQLTDTAAEAFSIALKAGKLGGEANWSTEKGIKRLSEESGGGGYGGIGDGVDRGGDDFSFRDEDGIAWYVRLLAILPFRLLATGLLQNNLHHRNLTRSHTDSASKDIPTGGTMSDESDVELFHDPPPPLFGIDGEEVTQQTLSATSAAASSDAAAATLDPAFFMPARATNASDGSTAASRAVNDIPQAPSFSKKSPSGGFLGLDLAYNCVGARGVAALHHVLTKVATDMLFLEIRGNTPSDTVADGGDGNGSGRNNPQNAGRKKHSGFSRCCSSQSAGTIGHLVTEIENTCAERRQRLLRGRDEDLRPRTCAPVAASRAMASCSPPLTVPPPRTISQRKSTTFGEISDSSRHRIRPWTGTGTGTGVGKKGAVRGSGSHAHAGGRCHSGDGGGIYDDISGGGGGREEGIRRFPGYDKSAAKPRPLEGALPMRGYYISPLVDSCFDMLMLREPAEDPSDYSFFVNRTRDKLKQWKELQQKQRHEQPQRHRRRGDARESRDKGVTVSDKLIVTTATAKEKSDRYEIFSRVDLREALPKKGMVVSPLKIHLEREKVLVERRRLCEADSEWFLLRLLPTTCITYRSDYVRRKNAKIAGRGRSKVSRSKVLTQKHSNTAFTKELQTRRPGSPGVKCPKALRAHYLGLQNFEYDWNADSIK